MNVEQLRRRFERIFRARQKNVLRIGRRAVVRTGRISGSPCVIKHFDPTREATLCFDNELLGQQLFRDSGWLLRAKKSGRRQLASAFYPQTTRLDHAVKTMDGTLKREVARQAMLIAWEIFQKGYAHRDFHPGNLFWVNDKLLLSDFETLCAYPSDAKPAFQQSYDVTGRGLPSPLKTQNMGYAAARDSTLQELLGVPADAAIVAVQDALKNELRAGSLSFQTLHKRHNCKAQKIYTSFCIPYLTVRPEEAQRNASRRLQQFEIEPKDVEKQSVLDLGSNVGGMLFQLQNFRPAFSLGIEYDEAKVAVARKVALFAGLRNLVFDQKDIDGMEPTDFDQKFDIAFCLAINKHVKRQRNLFNFLGKVTRGTLYFEGNSGTDMDMVKNALRAEGFQQIVDLGVSDDDCVSENNVRPILRARKTALA